MKQVLHFINSESGRTWTSGHFAEGLIQFDHLLKSLNEPTQQQKAHEILPPESMLALGDRLASEKLTEKEKELLTSYFNRMEGLFVAQESINDTILMLDCFGRIYRHSTKAPNTSVEIVNSTPVPDLNLTRAVDFVGIDLGASTYYAILDTRGQVHLKPTLTQGPLADLVKTINSDPLSDAFKLVLSADGKGAVVMNRDGFLREYGAITIPESELQRVGWPDYSIARDLKLSPNSDGLGTARWLGIGSHSG